MCNLTGMFLNGDRQEIQLIKQQWSVNGWGEGERINLGLNLKSLSLLCSFYYHSFKKKTMFMLFNRIPRICLCVWVKEIFTSPFLHFWPTTSSFPLLEICVESQDHGSGIQPVWTTHGSPIPLCCFVKAQGWIYGISIKQQSHSLRCNWCFINFPKSRRKQRCAILRESAEKKNLRMMKSTLLHKVYISVPIFLVLHTLKKSFQWTSSLIPFSISTSARCFTR